MRRPIAAFFFLLAACGKGDDSPSTAPASSSAPIAVTPLASTPIAIASAAPAPPPLPPGLFLMGRFDHPNEHPRFSWGGSTIRARFRGTGARAKLTDDWGHNYFRIRVDGGTPSVVETRSGTQTLVLAADLPLGEHEVEIVKRTEPRSGEVELVKLDFDDGELLAPPPHKSRHIELLGDSITTGWGIEGKDDVMCPDAAKMTDETQTAGALAAEMLDAEHTTIAWSAKTIREVTSLFERTIPTRNDSMWDFSIVPDAIVVNLGTNDFYNGDPGLETYERHYLRLLDKLRSKYKSAFVVALLGPMLSDAYPLGKQHYTLAHKYMQHAINAAKTRGDDRIALLDFGPADPADGYGCRFHPSPLTQRKMADAIVRVLKENLTW